MSVFYTGKTGVGTGAHLDFRVYNPATGGYEDPSSYTGYLTVGDNKDAFNFGVSSGFQPDGRVHPVTGEIKPHPGIDYLTPEGTALNVNGSLLSTWEDNGGGVMSQYLIDTDDGARELLLLHGSRQNKITGSGAVTDYDPAKFPVSNPNAGTGGSSNSSAVDAKERVQNYSEMSKGQLDAAYDKIRGDANAADEGMKMHKAFFKKR